MEETKLDLLRRFEELDNNGIECIYDCSSCDYLVICDYAEQKLEEKREMEKWWEED